MIALIEISSLFGGPSAARDATDRAIATAAETTGFLSVTASPEFLPVDVGTHRELLRAFELSDAEQRLLWRQVYDPSHSNVYRGWSPRSADAAVDIYDMGPDVARESSCTTSTDHRSTDDVGDRDPLLGHTPLPGLDVLPGWHETVRNYYRSIEHVGAMMMRSVGRTLGLDETYFDAAFTGGISTLRLMRYQLPPRDPSSSVEEPTDPDTPRRGEHVDSGFLTLLCQHGVGGLSVKMRNGAWVDIPPVDGHVVVNFGGVLERWTGGRIRATPHRVVSQGVTRYSIPFFFEPRVDAVIAPLPLSGAAQFEPFAYGDHLWAAMSKFPNFVGIADLRAPRGVALAR